MLFLPHFTQVSAQCHLLMRPPLTILPRTAPPCLNQYVSFYPLINIWDCISCLFVCLVYSPCKRMHKGRNNISVTLHPPCLKHHLAHIRHLIFLKYYWLNILSHTSSCICLLKANVASSSTPPKTKRFKQCKKCVITKYFTHKQYKRKENIYVPITQFKEENILNIVEPHEHPPNEASWYQAGRKCKREKGLFRFTSFFPHLFFKNGK